MKRIVLLLLLILTLPVLASLNWMWVGLLIASVVGVGLFLWKGRKAVWVRPVAFLLLAVLIIIMYFGKVVPRPGKPASITDLPLGQLGGIRGPSAEGYREAQQVKPPSPLVDMKRNFDQERYYKFRQRLPSLRDTPTRLIDAREILINIRQHGLFLETASRLDRSLSELDESWDKHSAERVEEIEALLEEGRSEINSMTSVDEIREYRRDWDTRYEKISLDEVYEDLTQLQEALDRVAQEIVAETVQVKTELRATYQEESDSFILDEWIQLTSPSPIIRNVNLSGIELASDYGTLEHDLLLSYGNCENGVEISADVEVRGGERSICVVNRVTVPATSSDLEGSPGFLKFRGLRFVWPWVYATKILVTLDLSEYRISNYFPYSLELKRDEEISAIVVPRHSYFQSQPVALREDTTTPGFLRPEQSLTPSFFRRHRYLWIELLPPVPLVRSSFVQKKSEYLFPENLIVALLIAAIGAAWAALFKRPE